VDDSSQPALIVAAHQDDEVIGLGSRLPSMRDSAIFVHTTDGALKKDAQALGFSDTAEYACARREELFAALALAGIPSDHCIALAFGDQQASTHLVQLTQRLLQVLLDLKPSVIYTHPYEGGHPDHDATAFAVHSAVGLLAPAGVSRPEILEFTSYHAAANGLEANEFLPYAGISICTKSLTEAERCLKAKMIDCFVTQRHVLSVFPLSIEKLRFAPRYHFDQAPHPGRLYYENFDWGMDGERWRKHAREAEQILGINDQWH
jgi:LmbE family N-acetylglucosaminyl deacetylase